MSILFLLTTLCFGSDSDNLKSIEFDCNQMKFGNTICYEKNQEKINSELIYERSIEIFNDLLISNNSNNQMCKNKIAHIYVIDTMLLNDKNVFHEFWGEKPDAETIWGLYYNQDGRLYITEHPGKTETTLAHEIGHYFYDVYCLDSKIYGNTEQFAEKFEALYRSRFLNE